MISGASILVIGGAGFVGSGLIRKIIAQKPERLVVIDNLLSAEEDNIPITSAIKFIRASCADRSVVQDIKDEFDFIFHLATYHGNESSIADPLADHKNNLLPTLLLYNHFKSFKRLRRLVYTSTGCSLAHKGISSEPVIETDYVSLDFDSPYQISKIVGEMYSIYFNRSYDMPIVRARFQNVYGPGEMLGAGAWRGTAATIWRNVVPTFIFRALHRQPLIVHGDGSNARDFIYIDDIADGLIRCASIPKISGEAFNLASGICVPIVELAKEINRVTGNSAGIELKPQRDWDRSIQRFGSTEKSKNVLGFETKVGLALGIANTVKWTNENLERIYKALKKHEDKYRISFLG